ERQGYIARVRHLARGCAVAYVGQRKELGYPLLKDAALREKLGIE
ncbi:MAG: glycine--tRNA ligase subunit alpha, partial [Clostridiales bacterium]|nr:glycine--tRNA ligase subunit alpha [Clostridiales bacterium]